MRTEVDEILMRVFSVACSTLEYSCIYLVSLRVSHIIYDISFYGVFYESYFTTDALCICEQTYFHLGVLSTFLHRSRFFRQSFFFFVSTRLLEIKNSNVTMTDFN